jgi:hypothetical protein
MSTTAAAAPQTSANEFLLQDHSGKVKATYYPFAPGPLIQGETPGPLFSYSGPEGDLSFRGSQVERQDTPLGQMVSVVLKPQNDTGSVTFSVFLPAVIFGDGSSENFATISVKARTLGFISKPGGQIHYETEHMQGTAKHGPVAL